MADWPAYRQVEVTSQEALWEVLQQAQGEKGLILITWKAAHRGKYVDRDTVRDALVAHGWVDGRRYKLDDDRTAQLITPRKQRAWAASDKARAEHIIATGRMQPQGLQAIEAAKASGLWNAMAAVDTLTLPDDLAAALGAHVVTWEAMAPSYRRNVLRWIATAKTAATRARRITQAADATAQGNKLTQM